MSRAKWSSKYYRVSSKGMVFSNITGCMLRLQTQSGKKNRKPNWFDFRLIGRNRVFPGHCPTGFQFYFPSISSVDGFAPAVFLVSEWLYSNQSMNLSIISMSSSALFEPFKKCRTVVTKRSCVPGDFLDAS